MECRVGSKEGMDGTAGPYDESFFAYKVEIEGNGRTAQLSGVIPRTVPPRSPDGSLIASTGRSGVVAHPTPVLNAQQTWIVPST